jgi:hypothetical protein
VGWGPCREGGVEAIARYIVLIKLMDDGGDDRRDVCDEVGVKWM